ncbi:HNH endonuclease [Promicromonospora sp. NPDC057138]|uniref:HNH endonuclease signature motif containing protein n=1 Tax=Promicromonospora sp. NPDC057138 TaxID=3346031 RepID=UPI00364030F1
MGEGQCDDGGGGTLPNGRLLDGALGADGSDAVPDGASFDDGAPFGEERPLDEVRPLDDMPPFDDVLPGSEAEAGAGQDWPPDWPPDVVPVAFWPTETLRTALRGVPGVQLARVVAEVADPETGLLADLPDDVLGDLVTASGRLQSWSAGVRARVVAERAARESSPLAHSSLVGQVTGELVVTEPEGTEVVVRAESGNRHPSVIDALETGRIDVRKAHTLLRSASQLTIAERAEAIRRFLPEAPRRTWKWLRARMLAFAKARHGAADAARAEAQRRSVHLDRAENDMGWLSAYLPATDAAAVWGVVDDMAHQLRHATGDDRSLGQLRADCLTGIVTGRLLPADRFTDTETDANPETDANAEPDNHTETGPRAVGSGAGASGTSSEDGVPDDGVPDGAEPHGAGSTVCTCGGRAPFQRVVQEVVHEVVQVVRVAPTRPVVRVTIPAGALLGLNDAPGDLAGFGPIPAETARIIAEDATWQRLLTDPITGILTDYSTTTYKPGKVLRAAVEARDDTCMFLTCDYPGAHCDLDHIEPFDHEHDTDMGNALGQTRAQNLQTLCRRHHLLKTHAGWGVVRDPQTGVTTWTTPTGHTHTRPPTVLDTGVELDQIDPDTSYDLTLRALTGQHLPRSCQTTEPGAVPETSDDPSTPARPDQPPF